LSVAPKEGSTRSELRPLASKRSRDDIIIHHPHLRTYLPHVKKTHLPSNRFRSKYVLMI
jgi:hypothetical protein